MAVESLNLKFSIPLNARSVKAFLNIQFQAITDTFMADAKQMIA